MYKLKQMMAAGLVFATTGFFGSGIQAQSTKLVKKTTDRPVSKSSLKRTPAVFENPALVMQYQETISPATLSSQLYFLASDYFEGRETGTRGQKLAAQYLAAQYRLLGLAPKGNFKTSDPLSLAVYFQPFSLYPSTPLETRLEVTVNGQKTASSVFSAETHDDLSYFLSGAANNASGEVVFAGYGIADDALAFNDYAALSAKGISVNDKWILIFDAEPLSDAATSLLPTADRKPSSWTTQFINKRIALWKAGRPKGILVVTDAGPGSGKTFAEMAAAASANARRIGNLSNFPTSEAPPAFAVSSKLANQILAPAGQKVEDLRQQINAGLKPSVFEIKGVSVDARVRPAKEVETENVLAFIEGSDPKLKDEVVVISSHYDHLGTNPLLTGDRIFNGAADDGSGAVASLELARAFMKAKKDGVGPRRSILFVNFSGEEKGTLGSFHYVNREPLVPLERTVADINLDGVGGIDTKHPTKSKNYIYLSGTKEFSEDLFEINRRVSKITGSSLELTDASNQGFTSDDQNFKEWLIPFIYYSTGRTEHYHTVRDEPETIDYDHFSRVVQIVFATAWQIANQEAAPSKIDRQNLTLAGYVCRPCSFSCDREIFERPGVCPMCGMHLIPKFVKKN